MRLLPIFLIAMSTFALPARADPEVSNAAYRQDHSYYLTANAGLLAMAYSIGTYVSDDWAVELDVGADVGFLMAPRSVVLLQGKYYLMDSFYFGAGVGQAVYCRASCSDDGDGESSSNDSATNLVDVALGNQWIFDSHVTAGVEWFGLSWPVGGDPDLPVPRLFMLSLGLSF